MSNTLLSGFAGMALSFWGTGPGRDTGLPIWRATTLAPTVAEVDSMIAAADLYDMQFLINVAGNRNNWTTSDGAGHLIFDIARYKAHVDLFRGNANLTSAFARRRCLAYVIDEPYLVLFNGTIPKTVQNDLCLYHKSIWDCLTVIRAAANRLEPPPAGGWTGLDYGVAQWERESVLTGMTKRQWFDDQRARFAAMNMGMVVGLNWQGGGDGRLWDYLNTGSSSGTIVGAEGAPRTVCSPAEIREFADAIWDDAQCPASSGFNFTNSVFGSREAEFTALEIRSDTVSAFDYMQNKFATRPLFSGYRNAKGTVTPPVGTAGEVQHVASTPVTTRVSTTSGTYADVPGAVIDSAGLSAGKRYLVVANGAFDLSVTNSTASVRVVSGSTQLAGSENTWRPVTATTSKWPYLFWTVVTAVAGENLSLQYKSDNGIASVGANFCNVFAMNLSDDLVQGTDYQYQLSTASTTLSTAFQDGAQITFVPATAGQDWLVLTSAHFAAPSATQSVVTGLRRDGEAVESDPEVQLEGRSPATDKYTMCTARVLTLTGSNTFAEHSKNTGGGGPRDASGVFALRLDRFAAHGFQYDNTELDYGSPSYGTTAATTGLTAPADGDLWLLGSLGMASLSNGIPSRQRLQLDAADSPSGQTAASYTYQTSYDTTEVAPILFQSVPAVLAGAHTASMSGSFSFPAAGKGAKGRLVMALTMRLTANPSGVLVFRRSGNDSIGTRSGTRKVR